MTTGLNPLVSFGELSQCTDDIGFCGVRSRDGWMAIEPIEIGDHSFLGPGSILRGGTRLDDDSLLGVMTLSPRSGRPREPRGSESRRSSCRGSPTPPIRRARSIRPGG